MKEFLLKSGISATVKQYHKHIFDVKALKDPGYFYLALDKKSRLHTYVNFHDPETHRFYNIQISRYYLMEAILHSLMIRPIKPPNNSSIWINKGIFDQLDITPENFNYQAALEYNENALRRIRSWLYIDNLSTKEKMIAQLQYDKIKDRLKSVDFIDTGTTINAMTRLSDVL